MSAIPNILFGSRTERTAMRGTGTTEDARALVTCVIQDVIQNAAGVIHENKEFQTPRF
jgi:hypothetical protein